MAASWECPSLPMLSLQLKETAKTSFLGLKPLIGAHYEENPDTFIEEIRQLDQLREHSTRPTKDYNGCSVLRRYFAQLHLLRARFPPETVGQIPVDFAWKDVYSGAEYIQEGFQIEQASLLYNIAALHAQLGSHGKRDTEQEMKESITHFQCSAGALSYLDEHFAINHASKDLSTEFVSLYNSLMLGQAQECLVEKSLKGIGRVKNATIARLATRVSEFYSRCVGLLEGNVCNVIAKKNKDWPKLLKFKVFYYQAIAHHYQGADAEEMGKYGELIALTQLTVQKLSSITGKPPKGMGDVMKQARQNFVDHITTKLDISKRQNEQVYHDTVPQIDALELVSGADLVKPVSFHPTDPKNLGTDIFARLIPMRAHEVASIYSEEKAKLMRSIVSSVDEKDQELQQFMRSLNVNEVDMIHEESPDIPSNVLRMHQSLQGRVGDVRKLHSSFLELIEMSRSVAEDFAALEEMKKNEETDERKFQSQYGVRPVSQVCDGLWKEMENYYKYNSQAERSNVELKGMFNQHYPNLVLLTSPLTSLKASLPKMTLLDAPTEDASESQRWKHLLEEVDKMTQQRQVLISRFRQQMSHDDITKNLVGHLGNDQEVFMEDHMKQFKELATIIRQNLTAQDNILSALTEANAKKASTRQTVQEITQQQQVMFARLIKSGGFLNLLQTKIQEGIAFYQKLRTSISRLRTRSEEVCDARKKERQNMAERQRRSMTPEPPTPTVPTPPNSTQQINVAPTRPPKKPELAGKPLLPEEQTPVQGDLPAGEGVSLNAHPPTTQLDIEELQRIQLQQQAMLIGGLKSPPPSGSPQPEEQQPTNVNTDHNVPAQHPKDIGPPPVTVSEAAQALNSLQNLMLLQPDSLISPSPAKPIVFGSGGKVIDSSASGGGNTDSVSSADHSQIPQRPPKPSHLKAGLLPSPFPSLPPSNEQNSTLNSLMEPQQPQFTSGHIPLHGVYPTSVSSSVTSPTSPEVTSSVTFSSHPQPTESLPFTPQLLQPPPNQADTTDLASIPTAQSINGASNDTSGVISPSEAPLQPIVPDTVANTMSQQTSNAGTQQATSQDEMVQPPMPISPPYYQPNINIQPGEVTVATSSILGPIPSAIAVPSTQQPSSLPHSITVTSDITTMQSNIQPPSEELQNTAVLQQSTVATSVDGDPTSPTSNTATIPTTTANISSTTSNVHTISTTASMPNTVHTLLQANGDPMHSDTLTTNGVHTNDEHRLNPTCISQTSDNSAGIDDDASLQIKTLTNSNGQPMLAGIDHQTHPQYLSDVEPITSSNVVPIQQPVGAHMSNMSVPTNLAATTTAVHHIPGTLNTKMVGDLSGVIPLPLTSLSSLATSLQLETPTDSTTEMIMNLAQQQTQQPASFVQIQLLQQNIDEQKKTIEVHKREKENFTRQEALYQQQIAQLQQQLHILQQRQDQEKAAASDQQTALMQLLHQQQGMFSQQQSQMEKLSQQDESHRKEYLNVEEKFRETLRIEQEMKVSLQSQILQLTQENQKLNQAIQGQVQQMQALQMQLQQYNVHIQERDKQLIAFKDQHKQIVDKLEQRNQQRVAQLVQKIQELQLLLNQRRDGGPSLPQPLQPTVIRMNPQQNQDIGPAGMKPNLPQPLRPSLPQGTPPSRPLAPGPMQHPGGVPSPTSHLPEAIQRPMSTQPAQGPAGHMGPTEPNTPNPTPMRHPSQPIHSSSVPMQQVVYPQPHPQVAPTSQPPLSGTLAQQHQQHSMSIPRSSASPLNIPPQPQVQPGQMQIPSNHPQMGLSNVHQPTPTSHSGAHSHQAHQGVSPRPISHPTLQSQASFPSTPSNIPHSHQQPHLQHQGPVFQSPSDPSLRQMHPQQMIHRPMGPDVPMSASPQVVPLQPSQLAGQRFPMQGRPMIRPNLQPRPTAGQPPYGHGVPGVHNPHFRGAAP